MKTIFITCLNPFIARNILAADVFKILKSRNDLRLVIFVPEYKVGWFKENFPAGNVVFEGITAQQIDRRDVLMTYLSSSVVDSHTLAIHKKEKLLKDGNYLKFFFSWLLRKFLGRPTFVKKLIRAIDLRIIATGRLADFFEKYKPALVFAADIYHNDDVRFIAAARKRGVPAVGMVRSWDNVTTKGMFRAEPDRLIVHNEIIKAEVIKYNAFPADKIFVSGIPQYDGYLRGSRMPREEFFKKIGLDPKRKLIMYSPFGDRFFKYDWQILEILKELDEQVLVRLTPNDKVDFSRFQPASDFYVDQPGHQFQKGFFRDTELNEADMAWLGDSLYHSDLVVVGGASIAIDAAFFGKPAVLIYFDGRESLPYIKSARRWLDFDHGRKLRESGGVAVAASKEDLLRRAKELLADPKSGQDNRQKMAKEQCWRLDGQSGKRIADFLTGLIDAGYNTA